MLCTLDYKADHVSEEKEREKSELLRQAIQSSIRKGDFYTRYNVRQYIVMLIEISQENCPIVSKRIAKKFNKLSGDKKFTQVDFYVASIGEKNAIGNRSFLQLFRKMKELEKEAK